MAGALLGAMLLLLLAATGLLVSATLRVRSVTEVILTTVPDSTPEPDIMFRASPTLPSRGGIRRSANGASAAPDGTYQRIPD